MRYVAEQFGISSNRVRQVIAKYGVIRVRVTVQRALPKCKWKGCTNKRHKRKGFEGLCYGHYLLRANYTL